MYRNIIKILRPTYWDVRRKILNNVIISKYLRESLKEKTTEESLCPICESNVKQQICFYFEGIKIVKYFCQECYHLYTNHLNADIEKASILFNYNKENENKNGQKHLLLLLEKNTRASYEKQRKLLDFGIGGNYSHIMELNKSCMNVEFYGCDIYPSDREYYFQTYTKEKKC